MEANINDRASVEAAYAEPAFAEDSGENSRAKAGVLRGVRILRAPDADGRFELEPARRHVGEQTGDAEQPFLAPFLETAVASGDAAAYGTMPARPLPPKAAEYAAFIDRLIDAARRLRPRASPGPDDVRLAGPRQ